MTAPFHHDHLSQLTKLYEDSFRGDIFSATKYFDQQQKEHGRLRGEFTVVIGPMPPHAIAARVEQEKQGLEARVRSRLPT